MFDAHPSFRFKHKRKGREFELEIRASLIRWLLIAIVTLACLANAMGPSQLLGILFEPAPLSYSNGLSPSPCEILQALRPATGRSGRTDRVMLAGKRAGLGTGKKKPAQKPCAASK